MNRMSRSTVSNDDKKTDNNDDSGTTQEIHSHCSMYSPYEEYAQQSFTFSVNKESVQKICF